MTNIRTKFCQHCGKEINYEAVICPGCGCQTKELKQSTVFITDDGIHKDKWIALLLCFFLGVVGGHKFYEGKVGMGILYIFTFGLFGIGILVDLITLIMKPNPYRAK